MVVVSSSESNTCALEGGPELPRLATPTAAPARSPDRTATREVPADLLGLLYRQVRGLAGQRPDLDDLVQEAAERTLRSWSRFEGRSALSTWTYGIAYRTVVDRDRWYHRWRRRFSFTSEDTVEPSYSFSAEGSVQELARARVLHAALDRLTPAKRAVVVLHELEGLGMKEIAEIVGTNERTVRSRLRDARKKLVELLSSDPLFQEKEP